MYKVIVGLMIARIIFLLCTVRAYKKLYELFKLNGVYLKLPYEIYSRIKIKEMSPAYILFLIPSFNVISTYRMLSKNIANETGNINLGAVGKDLLTHYVDIQVKYKEEDY